jgi:hypothetical protein
MRNVGTLDRLFRLVIGTVLTLAPFVTGWPVWTNPVALWASVVVGVVLVATSAIGFCPIYAALGLISKGRRPA